jgi:acetyltransferase
MRTIQAVAAKLVNSANLDIFFNPSSVVVIGASNAASNLGSTICKVLGVDIGYPGRVYAVNRAGEDVYGAKGFQSLDDISEPIDLAVIITPAFVVPGFVRKCGEKGIQNIVIESAGFSEAGEEGKRLQREIDEAARLYSIRIIGPNCLGILDNHSRFCCLYGSNHLAPQSVKHPGSVSYVVQSGGMAALLAGRLVEDVSGINKMVSLGNKSDLDEADFIDYFDTDNTEVIGLYLESIGDGRKLMKSVRQTRKPVLVYKTGKSEAGSAAVLSHTAGMAQNDAVFDGACRQAGMIRLTAPEELYTLPKMLTEMPLLTGKRIAVFTNSGAFGTIGADLLADTDLVMAPFSAETKAKLEKLPGVFNAGNPVDIGPAPPEVYLEIYSILLNAGEVDGILHMVSMWRDFVSDVMETLVGLCRTHQKPAALYAFSEMEILRKAQLEKRLPLFSAAQEAVRALTISYQQHQSMQKKEKTLWTK